MTPRLVRLPTLAEIDAELLRRRARVTPSGNGHVAGVEFGEVLATDELAVLRRVCAWLGIEKYSEDQPRDESGRWSSGGAGGGTRDPFSSPGAGARVGSLRVIAERAFTGESVTLREKPSKPEQGRIGERLAVEWFRGRGLSDVSAMNLRSSNFPVDLIHDHEVVEVKAGLVSNTRGAQKWRATIGEPGEKEKAWLTKASPAAKARWNKEKQRAILRRKTAIVRQVSRQQGVAMKARTVALLLNTDARTADVYAFPGFHKAIRWNSPQARAGYVATVRYGKEP